ncbi:hypothetical protein J7L05_03835 [bacterium]|nr:hypothetical protein [bacterium]
MFLTKRILQSLLLMLIFILPLFPANAQAQELDDPILEYSYHLKMDLSVIKSYVDRIFDTSGMSKDQTAEIEKIYQKLLSSGLCDLEDVTLDCQFEREWVLGKALVRFKDSLSERGAINDFVQPQSRMSMVRTLIPEQETLAWATVMEPGDAINLIHRFMEQCNPGEKKKECGKYKFFHGVSEKAEKLIGDEMNLIISDLEMPMMGEPVIKGGLIFSMAENITQKDMDMLAGIMDNIFIEENKATKKKSKWHSFDVVTYTDLGIPGDIEPSFIIDKYYFVMATDPETLEQIADHVLNPKRTAYSSVMPPVMNAMITFNVDKFMAIIPDDAFSAMTMMTGDDLHKGKIRELIENEDLGIVRFESSHTSDGVRLFCRMNRSIYSLIYHVSIEGMIMGLKENMKYMFKAKEAEVKSNTHSIQIAIERYAVDYAGQYPDDAEQLITKGYMSAFPINPYTDAPMVECGFPGTPGNFMYIPIFDDENVKVIKYELMGFGAEGNQADKINNDLLIEEGTVKEEPDGKIDKVLIVVQSGY